MSAELYQFANEGFLDAIQTNCSGAYCVDVLHVMLLLSDEATHLAMQSKHLFLAPGERSTFETTETNDRQITSKATNTGCCSSEQNKRQ